MVKPSFHRKSENGRQSRGKIDIIYCELIKKFEAISEHIKRLDGRIAQNVIAIKRKEGLSHKGLTLVPDAKSVLSY